MAFLLLFGVVLFVCVCVIECVSSPQRFVSVYERDGLYTIIIQAMALTYCTIFIVSKQRQHQPPPPQ